jgi:hypothetical protein
MAKKAAARSPKSSITVVAPRPRNLLSIAARQRSAGPHGPTRKAERVAARVRLKKGLDSA